MKAFLLKLAILVLPEVLDMIIMALHSLAKRSDNTIDDLVVGAFMAHKDQIVSEIKKG